MTKLDIDESAVAVTSEPPPMNCMFVSTHIFNAKNTENRAFEVEREQQGLLGKDETLLDDEHVLGVYSHSYAIEQTCLPWFPTKRCCTHRDELTNTLKITSKRVEFSMDEAHGCWPNLDDESLEVGKGFCCVCGCCPGGLMQTKALSVGDISGYSREVAVPRVVYLSTFRFALFFYMLTVILVTCGMMMGNSTAFKDAISKGLKKFDSESGYNATAALNNATGFNNAWQPAVQQPAEVLGIALGGLAATLLVFYVIVDAIMKWGWKFVMCSLLIIVPVVVYFWLSIELAIQYILSSKGKGAIRGQLAPFQDMLVIANASGFVVATLPFFLILGYLYLAFFALRVYKLTLNFSNKVSYSVTLQEEQLDDALNKIANLLGFSQIADAADVEGAGWCQQCHGWGKKVTDIPVDMPGEVLQERPFTAGGGCKLTNRALALHHETYSFIFGGPELTQVTKVFMHKTMSKLTRTTHFLSFFWRKFFLFLGMLLIVNGIIQLLGAYQAKVSARASVYLDFIPCPAMLENRFGDENCASFIAKVLVSAEVQIVLGLVFICIPVVLQCIVKMCECTEVLEAQYNWGTDTLKVRMEASKAEEFEADIVKYAGKSRGGTHHDHDERAVAGPYESLPTNQCLRLFACFGQWFGFTKLLTITDSRIKIEEDDGHTVITYWRDSMTEADIGPMSWCICGCGLPCLDGWHRPKGDDPVRLSINMGWQTTANKVMALPGTNLATTELFLFDITTAEQIMTKLDPIIGNYIHHEWSPDAIQTAVHG